MKHRLLVAALVAVGLAQAQVGNQFPKLEGETLTNEIFNLPDDLGGKYALISMAYSKKSEDDLASWFNPVWNTFIKESTGLFNINYDMHVYFVPMFTGAKRPAYQTAMKKVQQTVDPLIQPHVLFYKGTIHQYKEALNFQGNDVPYFYIIDPSGKIMAMASGKYTQAKMQELVDAVEPAIKK